jgi:hypothetical protein
LSKLIEKLEDIAIVEIDLRSRKIILWAKDGEGLKWGSDVIKFAKSSPVGLVIQGITKWCYGHVMDDRYVNPDTAPLTRKVAK